MYPDRDAFNKQCSPLGIHYKRDQSVVESRVTEGGKNQHCQFSFLSNTTTQTQSLKLNATIFKVVLEEKQQLVEEKDAYNIRKVLCKSFIF